MANPLICCMARLVKVSSMKGWFVFLVKVPEISSPLPFCADNQIYITPQSSVYRLKDTTLRFRFILTVYSHLYCIYIVFCNIYLLWRHVMMRLWRLRHRRSPRVPAVVLEPPPPNRSPPAVGPPAGASIPPPSSESSPPPSRSIAAFCKTNTITSINYWISCLVTADRSHSTLWRK